MKEIQDSYDNLPYFSMAFPECSPTRIEAIASFLSFNPPSSKEAKVLEIGCSYGGNLFPFAIANPDAKVVGIDLSEVQINKAKELAKQMRVDNIKFIQKDICELNDEDVKEFGKFDYIICHGVYSWVPDFVKEAILKTIKKLLSPNGIAYISYNVYPGWKIKDIIRDFLMFGTKELENEGEIIRANKAKELLSVFKEYMKFCTKDGIKADFMNAKLLLEHIEGIEKIKSDSYIVHEYLEIFNDPIYFKDFAKRLDDEGLAYLSDVNLDDVFKADLGLEGFDEYINANFTNRIDKEQAIDFFTNRVFRQSLITHKELIDEDFHVDIGVEELSRIYLAAGFSKDKDGHYVNSKNQQMKPNYNWLYQVFSDVYPASINFAQVAALLGDDENAIKSAYMGFMEILAASCALLSTYEKQKVVYKAGKSRLKERVVGYFEYFSMTNEPVIMPADAFNGALNLSNFDAFIALKFNGKNSTEDIIKQTAKFAQERGLNFTLTSDNSVVKTQTKKEFDKAVSDYVKDLERKLTQAHMFEIF
ncbi:class I SAM-dependent methyltransferase [Campylobacter sp. RM16192]|uniref:class I SAM-dependent methyltransferase n=1 Tax=Campylobacter sp. RM16192 TaxID=1660080 RepID=UPI0014515085|nr:class I SAM-dependent methyltransferase [Campylobacter sp. RM16192]QCD53239.1 SAM-dependent methyltransferase [Campylobacter sp. RM16192]